MKWIINLIAKYSGASAMWDKVDGYKSYLSGTALILTGLAGLITGVSGIADIAGLIMFIKALAANEAWSTLLAGLAVVGLRNSNQKANGI